MEDSVWSKDSAAESWCKSWRAVALKQLLITVTTSCSDWSWPSEASLQVMVSRSLLGSHTEKTCICKQLRASFRKTVEAALWCWTCPPIFWSFGKHSSSPWDTAAGFTPPLYTNSFAPGYFECVAGCTFLFAALQLRHFVTNSAEMSGEFLTPLGSVEAFYAAEQDV